MVMLLEMNESFYGFSTNNLGTDLIVPPSHPSPHHLSTSGCFGLPSPNPNGAFGGMSMMGLGSSSATLDLAEGNTSGSSSDREPPDSKVDIDDELCPVCGDKVSGYHYGLLTCESCKGFFKRTVQNKKVYTCVGERSCHIDKSQRKRCPFCRFQKCLEVGMKLEAVRSDRMRGGRNKFGPMYKRDRARKLQALRTRQQLTYNPLGHNHGLSHSRSNSGKSDDSANYVLPPIGNGSLMYDFHSASASRKTEMIQIPHLSSTNSPENLHLVAADTNSNSHAPASWSGTGSPNSGAPCNQNIALLNIGGMHLHGTRSPGQPLMEAGEPGQIILPRSVTELQMTLIDDKIWQDNLHALLHQQTYNQCEVDSFELLCKVLDQCSFLQVEWAKNSAYFKDLQVEDQSSLIQHSWSEMVILDFVYHRLFNNLPDETTLPNGQAFCFLDLVILGANTNIELLHSFTARLRELKFDRNDYVCFKFLLLLRSDVPRLIDRGHVRTSQEHVQRLFLEHCIGVYPHMPERFSQLLLVLSELTVMANHGEEYLYYKHMTGAASTKTLLMELLSGPKRKH